MKKSTTKRILLCGGSILVLVLLLSWNRIFTVKSVHLVVDPNTLPGIQTNAAPWQPELAYLHRRLVEIGLPALAREGNALHIHQHIDLFINGQLLAVPAEIGINRIESFISPVHTHDASGVIHVESNAVRDFTLGEFFDVWGVRFTKDCIGGYCTATTSALMVYANGSRVPGDPRSLVLAPHQEIVVVYGTDAEVPQTIPASYPFLPGY